MRYLGWTLALLLLLAAPAWPLGGSGGGGGASSGVRPIIWTAASLSVDGAQCAAAPEEVTINSGPVLYTIKNCADNDASTLYASIVPMPAAWDGGTIVVGVAGVQTAADTDALHMDVSASCRGAGVAINSTYGTEVALDDADVNGSNAPDWILSAAVTPNGSCAGLDWLFIKIQIDATGTTTDLSTYNFGGVYVGYTADTFEP